MDDNSAFDLRELVFEEDGVLAEAAADVDEDCRVARRLEACKFLLDRVRADPALYRVENHDMPEGFHLLGILLEEIERCEVSAQSLMERQILGVVHVLVLVILEPLSQNVGDRRMYVGDMRCTARNMRVRETLRYAIGLVRVLATLLDEAIGCHGAQKMLHQMWCSASLFNEVLGCDCLARRRERGEDVEIYADLDKSPAKRLKTCR